MLVFLGDILHTIYVVLLFDGFLNLYRFIGGTRFFKRLPISGVSADNFSTWLSAILLGDDCSIGHISPLF